MPIRKETAERMARRFLQAHYPQGSFEIHEVKWVNSPYEYIVTGRVNSSGDFVGRPRWANFEILVNPQTEKFIDYKIEGE